MRVRALGERRKTRAERIGGVPLVGDVARPHEPAVRGCGGRHDDRQLGPGLERSVDLILRVASGEKTKSEALGFGDDEFAPWQIGAVV